MDSSTACDDSASDYLHGTSDSVHTNVTHKQCMCCKRITTDDTVGEELGNALNELQLIQDVEKMVSGCTLGTKEGISPEEDSLCEELQSNQIDSSTTTNEKVLSKSATFPLSKKLACANCTSGNDEIHGMACDDGPCCIKSDKPACTRSISLPTSMKLVSAMKGSREKRGLPDKIMTVKWAPDVYDPPVTSLSHTVNGYSQQRSRSNRKNSKQKHKGKSSRGSSEKKGSTEKKGSSEKKQHRKQTGNSEPRSKSRGASNALYESTEDYLNYSVTGQESNCGSSFLRTSVGKVHISFAEAT